MRYSPGPTLAPVMPTAIDGYIGKGRRFDDALGEFAVRYADQTAMDHGGLLIAAEEGVVAAEFA